MPDEIDATAASGQTITSSGTNSNESSLILGAAMKGIHVCARSGDRLGIIVDSILDPVTARVIYYSVEFESGNGKLHAVPVARLEYDHERGVYLSDLSEDQIHSAPLQSEILHEGRS